jgi:hypothetical protein
MATMQLRNSCGSGYGCCGRSGGGNGDSNDDSDSSDNNNEQGSAKVAKGKQATAKVKRWRSTLQCNKQPTAKWGMAKLAREKQVAHRSKEEEQWCAMQQPTNN